MVLCQECRKRFYPKDVTEWVCPRCRKQMKLTAWMDVREEGWRVTSAQSRADVTRPIRR